MPRGRSREPSSLSGRPQTGASHVSIEGSTATSPSRRSRKWSRGGSRGESTDGGEQRRSTSRRRSSRGSSVGSDTGSKSRASSKSRRAEVAVSDALAYLPHSDTDDNGKKIPLKGSRLRRTIAALRDLALPMSLRSDVRDRFRETGSMLSVAKLAKHGVDERVMLLSLKLLSRCFTDRFRIVPSLEAYHNPDNQLYFMQECHGLSVLMEIIDAPFTGAKGLHDDVRGAACVLAADALFSCAENRDMAFKGGMIESLTRLITSSRCGAATQGCAARCLSLMDSEEHIGVLVASNSYPAVISLLSSVHPESKIGGMLVLSAAARHGVADALIETMGAFQAVAQMIQEPSGAVCAAALRVITDMLKLDPGADHLPERIKAVEKSGAIGRALALLKCNHTDLCHAANDFVLQLFSVKPVKKLRKKMADGAASPERTVGATSVSPSKGKEAKAPAKTPSKTPSKTPAKTPAKTPGTTKALEQASGDNQPLAKKLRDKFNDELRESLCQLLSSPAEGVVDVGLLLCNKLVDEEGDFREMVAQQSVAWAVTALIVRNDHSSSTRKRALALLERTAVHVESVRVHLENAVVKAFMEEVKDDEVEGLGHKEKEQLARDLRKARLEQRAAELQAAKERQKAATQKANQVAKTKKKASPGEAPPPPTRSEGMVRDLNGQSVDEDVIATLEIMCDTGQGEMMRIEAMRWLQGIVRADKHGRELLMVSGFCVKAIDLLRADPVLVTPPIKVGCVDLVSDLCTNVWYTPMGSEHVWFDHTHQEIVLSEASCFHELSLLTAQLFRDERTLSETGAARLMEATARALMSVVKGNSQAQIASARSGLLYAAAEMAASPTYLYQSLGVGLVERICTQSPVIARLCLSLGDPTPKGPWLPVTLARQLQPLSIKIDLDTEEVGSPGLGSAKGATTGLGATSRGRTGAPPRGTPGRGVTGGSSIKRTTDEKEFKRQAMEAQQAMLEEMEPSIISACRALAAICDACGSEGGGRKKRAWVARIGVPALVLLSHESCWVRASAALLLSAVRRCWPEGATDKVLPPLSRQALGVVDQLLIEDGDEEHDSKELVAPEASAEAAGSVEGEVSSESLGGTTASGTGKSARFGKNAPGKGTPGKAGAGAKRGDDDRKDASSPALTRRGMATRGATGKLESPSPGAKTPASARDSTAREGKREAAAAPGKGTPAKTPVRMSPGLRPKSPEAEGSRPSTAESEEDEAWVSGGRVLESAVRLLMKPDEMLSVVVRQCTILLCTELRYGSVPAIGFAVATAMCGSKLASMVLALDDGSFQDFEDAMDMYCLAAKRVRQPFYEDGGLLFLTGALSGTAKYSLSAEALQGLRESCAYVLGSLANADATCAKDAPVLHLQPGAEPEPDLAHNFETPQVRMTVTELVHSLSAGGGGRLHVFARALGALGTNRTIRTAVVAREALMPLASTLASNHPHAVAEAATAIGILASHWLDVKMRNKCKLAGVIPHLIEGLNLPHNTTQAACCFALMNVARLESDVRAVLTQHRGVEHAARLLRCRTSLAVQASAAHCIAAVTETATGAKQLLERGGATSLCSLLASKQPRLIVAAAGVAGVMGEREDQYEATQWAQLRTAFVKGGGVASLVEIVQMASRGESVVQVKAPAKSASLQRPASSESRGYTASSLQGDVKATPRSPERDLLSAKAGSIPTLAAAAMAEVKPDLEEVVACVEALGRLAKVADMREALAKLEATAMVRGLVESDWGGVVTMCACVRSASSLWMALVEEESTDDDDDEEDVQKAKKSILPTERDADMGEWLIGRVMDMLHSEDAREREAACYCCKDLAGDPNMLAGMVAGQLFEHCTTVMEEKRAPMEVEAAMTALEALCWKIPGDAARCSVGVTAALYERLSSESMFGIGQAARTMCAMSVTQEGIESVTRELPGVKLEGITPLVEVLTSCPSTTVQAELCSTLRVIATHARWAFVVCEMAGAKFISMLQSDKLVAVLSAAHALAGLAQISEKARSLLQEAGICPVLDGLVQDSSEDVRLAACTAIRNLARDGHANEIFIKIGTIRQLVYIQQTQSVKMIVRATDTLYIMFKHVNVQVSYVKIGGLEALDDMLSHPSVAVQECAARLLKRLFNNPRIKHAACTHPILTSLSAAIKDASKRADTVRAMIVDALRALSGNENTVNLPYRKILIQHGLVASCVEMLSCPSDLARRSACNMICNLAVVSTVQDELRSRGAVERLHAIAASTGCSGALLVAACRALARVCMSNPPNRLVLRKEGGCKTLTRLLLWVPDEKRASVQLAHAKLRAQTKHETKERRDGIAPAQAAQGAFKEALRNSHRRSMSARGLLQGVSKQEAPRASVEGLASMWDVRSASADALSSLIECAGCRRSYIGGLEDAVDLHGMRLKLPAMGSAYACTYHTDCIEGVQGVHACTDTLPALVDLLMCPSTKPKCAAAMALSALAVGSPFHGVCEIGASVRKFALKKGVLAELLEMMKPALPGAEKGRAAALQFAAARALSSLAVSDEVKKEACRSGFLRPLSEMLFSTYGRIKGSAAVVLARLSGSSEMVFYWDKNTNHTHWDIPKDLVTIPTVNGPEELKEEDVIYDTAKKCFWVRGIMKPYERIPYCEMLTSVVECKFGPHAGDCTLKAEPKWVSRRGALDVILDIYRSPLFDGEVSGWAAEATCLLCEYESNRRTIAETEGSVGLIVELLSNGHAVWQEQACTALTTLLNDPVARHRAGAAGAAVALADLLRGPYVPNSLKRVATLAMGRLCSQQGNQVLSLQAGALMPLVEMLSHEEEQTWFCAAEALTQVSSNDTNKRMLGDAGIIPAVLRRLHSDSPQAIQVRVLAVTIKCIGDQANLDAATSGGILPLLITMAGDQSDDLILQYIAIALQVLSRAVRHVRLYVETGIIECMFSILSRCAGDGIYSQSPRSATVRLCMSDVLRSLCMVDGLRQTLIEKAAFEMAAWLLGCPESNVNADAASVVAMLAGSRDESKELAREAGVVPLIARLVCSKHLQSRLEAASAVRVLAPNIENKRLLVEKGALHGLRDMMDSSIPEARLRANEAIYRLSNNQVNGYDLSRAGTIRPLVNIIGSSASINAKMRPQAADTLGRMARIHVWDNRKEVATFGAIPALTSALQTMRYDDDGSSRVTKALRLLSRHDQLDAHAAHAARSEITAAGRVGLVPPDPVASVNRESISRTGVRSRLQEIVDSSGHAELVRQAAATLEQIDQLDIEVKSRGSSRMGTEALGGVPDGGRGSPTR